MSDDYHDSISKKNIILFGEALADIFPDGPVMGGAPLNVSRHLRAFGLNPILITRTGTDALQQKLMQLMQDTGMNTIGIQNDPNHPTGQVHVHPGRNGGEHTFEILAGQAYDFIDAFTAGTTASASKPDLMYFGTLAQRSQTSATALETVFRNTPQVPRLLDINLRQPWYTSETVRYSLTRADHVKVNEDELLELPTLLDWPIKQGEAIAAQLVQEFHLRSLLVTRGADGAWLLDPAGKRTETAGVTNIPIVDTVGAGDGFSAVFITGLLLKWPATQLLERANQFAAALCGIRGAIPDTTEFYAPFLSDWELESKH